MHFLPNFTLELARRKGLEISIVLFDRKDFIQKGPRGCNLCAGVIAESLIQRLERRGISLPPRKVQRKIGAYYFQLKSSGWLLKHPLKKDAITTVFRGNGPRFSAQEGNISFDDYLLEQIRRREGVEIVPCPVNRIELPPDLHNPVKIIYGSGDNQLSMEAELVVCAFGLNSNLLNKIVKMGFGYVPPETVRARCMEIFLGEEIILEHFGNTIYICNWRSAGGMFYAGIIPKKDYLTMNVVGERDAGKNELMKLLNLSEVRKRFPEGFKPPENFCSCSPKVAFSAAKKPFTNRLVIIGDACCSRYYKNGIESAFLTAKAAANAVFNAGVSESDLRDEYYRKIKRLIIRDNFYGRILFKADELVYRSPFLSKVLMRLAIDEEKRGKGGIASVILWNMYTGNIPYRKIFRMALTPAFWWKLIIGVFSY